MDLFSIGLDDEDLTPQAYTEPSKRCLHPAFFPSSLPVQHLSKGSLTGYIGAPIHYCLQQHRKPMFRQLFAKEKKEWVPRVLKVKEGYLYAYERKDNGWILRGVWDLTRLISLEMSAESPNEITFVFPNKSLEPIDPLKRKTFQVSDLPPLLTVLRTHLKQNDIDFDTNPMAICLMG